jgi:hypothetical protein
MRDIRSGVEPGPTLTISEHDGSRAYVENSLDRLPWGDIWTEEPSCIVKAQLHEATLTSHLFAYGASAGKSRPERGSEVDVEYDRNIALARKFDGLQNGISRWL